MIEIYIGGRRAELNADSTLTLTHELESLTSPTAVKNTYSQTLKLPNTPKNNAIFGQIWRFDNVVGVFDPTQRVDAVIIANSDIFQIGYVQLDTVRYSGPNWTYELTFYGGLGDFFYNLQTKEDGTPRTLADLTFGIKDAAGNTLPADTELNFKITKEFVSACWSHNLDTEGDTLQSFLSFAPAYNGLRQDFENDKVLIDTRNQSLFPTQIDNDGTTYQPRNGYALGTLREEMEEWAMRDLRSYYQRPVVKLSKVMQAIFDASGYEVVPDPAVMSNANPIWRDGWIMLPLLGSESEDADDVTSAPTTALGLAPVLDASTHVGDQDIIPTGDTFELVRGVAVDVSDYLEASTITVSTAVQISASPANGITWGRHAMYMSAVYDGHTRWGGICVQLQVYGDESETPIGVSKCYNFTNALAGYDTWVPANPFGNDAEVETVQGHFVWNAAAGRHEFQGDGLTAPAPLEIKIEDLPRSADIIGVRLAVANVVARSDYGQVFTAMRSGLPTAAAFTYGLGSGQFAVNTPSGIVSGSEVTKQILFPSEHTCLDYLLGWAKMLGLYFVRDEYDKKIYIHRRAAFYRNEIVDWSDRIARNKEITMTPVVFSSKYYRMALETPETAPAERYENDYGVTYGQQRIDTGTNFNADTTDLLDDNIYQNPIDYVDVSKYYRTYNDADGTDLPPFAVNGIEYTLYNGEDDAQTNVQLNNRIAVTKEWSRYAGNDMWAKCCLFGDDRSGVDLSQALVFYTGKRPLEDYATEKQQTEGITAAPVTYRVTDDLAEMLNLAEGRCWLWTTDPQLGIPVTELPQFTRMYVQGGQMLYTLDIGQPREIYVPDLVYRGDRTIYAEYWSAYLRDQMNSNTRKLTCYVNMQGLKVTPQLFRTFYRFDGCIWVLNKIEDYTLGGGEPTKCEFIKVQNINSYLQ